MKNKLFLTFALSLLVTIVFGQDSTDVGGGGEVGFTLFEKISAGLNAVLAIVTTIFGVKLSKLTGTAGSALSIAQTKASQAIALASKAIAALEDGSISPAELEGLKAAYKELKG